MLELHGWLTIRDNEENLDDFIDEIIVKLDNKINELKLEKQNVRIEVMNGEYFVNLNAITNRKTQEIYEIMDFIEYVRTISSRSYGVLYLRDDEDIYGKDNEFQVYILKKGTLKREKDNFLSPCIPAIED